MIEGMGTEGLVLDATIRCPHCGAEKLESMPANACVHYYECSSCRTLIRPKPTRYFLAHGADPKVQNDEGKTAIGLAADQGRAAILKLLKGQS